MLSEMNQLLASILAVALLLLILAAPFMAAWIGLSIRRDLRRVADALESTNRQELDAARAAWREALDSSAPKPRPVSNSAFGR